MTEEQWKSVAMQIVVDGRLIAPESVITALYPIVQQAIAAERGEPVAVPHVVYDMKMPPYHYQKPYTGSGGSISVPSAPPTEAQIRADERERCAKVADEHRCKPDSPVHRGTDNTARMIAAAIRSLKESDNGAG